MKLYLQVFHSGSPISASLCRPVQRPQYKILGVFQSPKVYCFDLKLVNFSYYSFFHARIQHQSQCIFLCPLYDATSAVQCGDRSALQPRTFGTLFGVRSACYPLGFGEGTQRLQSRVGEWRVGAHAFNHHNADSVLRDTVQSCQVTQGSPSSAIKWPLKGEPPGSPVCSRCRTGLMCAGSPALSTLSGYTGERGLPAKSTR